MTSRWLPHRQSRKGRASVKAAVNIGDPEPYDRYFGCMHREFQTSGCLRRHTLLHSPFEARSQQPHNTEHKTGGSMMNQHGMDQTPHTTPKRLYQPVDEGGDVTCQNTSRITFFDKKVTLKSCPSITDGTIRGAMMFIQMIGKHLAIKQMNSGQEKQFL